MIAWPYSQTSQIYNSAFWADLHLFPFPISRLARGSSELSCVFYHNVKHGYVVITHRLLGTPASSPTFLPPSGLLQPAIQLTESALTFTLGCTYVCADICS